MYCERLLRNSVQTSARAMCCIYDRESSERALYQVSLVNIDKLYNIHKLHRVLLLHRGDSLDCRCRLDCPKISCMHGMQ